MNATWVTAVTLILATLHMCAQAQQIVSTQSQQTGAPPSNAAYVQTQPTPKHRRRSRHTDMIYAYVDGEPEYCLAAVRDSPSCVAEMKVNAPEIKREQAEMAAMEKVNSPAYIAQLCKESHASNIDRCVSDVQALHTEPPRAASSFPIFDIDSYCRELGDMAGGSNEIELTCRHQEEAARDWARDHDTSQRTAKYCRGVAETANSYEIFKTCVEQEEDAGSHL